jgi:psp operon transcriptional activator
MASLGSIDPEHFDALGQSEAFLEFQENLSRAAKVERPVLLIGERGTGKELAATRLHYLSPRWKERLVTLNCSALAPGLIESELFGHEAGSFTGAVGRRAGRFELANSGTLFLDEIGNIPLEVQEKILRVVEYNAFERVGASHSIRVDVRIIGATNANLVAMAEMNRFKRDLLDRLSFEVLFLPPLRHRHGDIMLLANHFAARMARELDHAEPPVFSEEAVAALESHAWPGNVRELKNVVERAVYRSDEPVVREIAFHPFQSRFAPQDDSPPHAATSAAREAAEPEADGPLEPAVRALEIRMLRKTLQRANGNQRRAAALLGLSYHQFRGYYRKYKADLM